MSPIPKEVSIARILWTIIWESVLPLTFAMVFTVATGLLAFHWANPLATAATIVVGIYVYAAVCIVRYKTYKLVPAEMFRSPAQLFRKLKLSDRRVLLVSALIFVLPLAVAMVPVVVIIVLPVIGFNRMLARLNIFDPRVAADSDRMTCNREASFVGLAAFVLAAIFAYSPLTGYMAGKVLVAIAVFAVANYLFAIILRARKYDTARYVARKLTPEVWDQILLGTADKTFAFCERYPLQARRDMTPAELLRTCTEFRTLVDAIDEARSQLRPQSNHGVYLLLVMLVLYRVIALKNMLCPPAHTTLWPELYRQRV